MSIMVNPTERRIHNEFDDMKGFLIKDKKLREEFNNLRGFLIEREILESSKEEIWNVSFNILYKKQYISVKMKCSYYYPFRPPYEVIINNKLYNGSFQISQKIRNYFKERHNRDCLCCTSILCDNNWQPTKSLMHIFIEYKETKEIINNYLNYSYVYNNFKYELPSELWDNIIKYLNL